MEVFGYPGNVFDYQVLFCEALRQASARKKWNIWAAVYTFKLWVEIREGSGRKLVYNENTYLSQEQSPWIWQATSSTHVQEETYFL